MLLDQHESNTDNIKHVAIYLRKSRSMGDSEEDLANHDVVMKQICKTKGWSYVEYREIVSGDTIEGRPQIKKLLKDISNGLYDGVLTFDIDRLGRGGGGDRERIGITLQHSNTFLITANPYKIYDLNNESDEQAFDMYSFMGRFEYKTIKRRLQAGKRIGLKRGRWVHGNVPYGYEYNRKEKSLEVVEEEKEVVRMIVDYALEGMSFSNIANELNKRKILSPGGARWRVTTVSRVLKSKVYLGHVVGNKTEGNRNRTPNSSSKPFKHLPENEWIVVKDCHEAIITQEEYDELQRLFKSKTKKVYTNNIYQFSGLIKCGQCNKNMHYKHMGDGNYNVAICECGNRGGSIKLIEDAVFKSLDYLRQALNEVKNDRIKQQKEDKLSKRILDTKRELDKQDLAIERIEEAFESGLYDVQKTKVKIQEREQEKWRLKKELAQLNKQFDSISIQNNKERISTIDKFISDIKKESGQEERNHLFKSIISEITWTKLEDDKVDISVNFL